MSTNGAWGFYKDGQHKVAYNHCDSYPAVLGAAVLTYCRTNTVGALRADCDHLTVVDSDQLPTVEQQQHCIQLGAYDGMVGSQSPNTWYCLLRHTQGNPAFTVRVGFIEDSQAFLGNSICCEYAYVINLDDEVLEVYEGFQKERPQGRYAEWPKDEFGFYAVSLVQTFPLSDLPKTTEGWIPDDENE